MENSEMDFFISGLKSVIKNNWPSQEKFAEGLTSKVNLSNVLRGTSGTSLEMRKKMASKAGMTVEDVIAIGQGSLRRRASDKQPTTPSVMTTPEDIAGMDTTSLGNWLNAYTSDLTDYCMSHAKSVTHVVRELVKERNSLVTKLEHEELLDNALGLAIRIVDKSLNTVYTNDVYANCYNTNSKHRCTVSKCPICDGTCLAQQVFTTGLPAQTLCEIDGTWFFRKAFPLLTLTGKIRNVVVTSIPIGDIAGALAAAGLEKKEEVSSDVHS